jgi:hypothetical protein
MSKTDMNMCRAYAFDARPTPGARHLEGLNRHSRIGAPRGDSAGLAGEPTGAAAGDNGPNAFFTFPENRKTGKPEKWFSGKGAFSMRCESPAGANR